MHGYDRNRILKLLRCVHQMRVTVEGNAENPVHIENLDKGSGEIDSEGNWKRMCALGNATHDCLGFVWVQC